MRELAAEVLELQNQWTDKNTPAMQRRGILIRDQIPGWLNSISSQLQSALGPVGADLSFEGRDGTGRKTEIPWVRFYSESRSPNAREGWYCVYLFHALGDGFYLSLGHGSTRYEGGEFRPRSSQELGTLVSWARRILELQLASVPALVTRISLGARKSDLGPAYADGTVAAIWYPKNAIPEAAALAADARQFAGLLAQVYNQQDLGRLPDSQALDVEAAAAAVEKVAHPLRRRNSAGQGYGLTQQERRIVELHAMAVARKHLEGLGLSVEDVSAMESFDFRAKESDRELIIEVKGTTGSCEAVLLTAPEVAIRAYPNNALIVVYEINLDRNRKPPVASGGLLRALTPWRIEPEALMPSAYKYSLPQET
jgi:hypothetical protein